MTKRCCARNCENSSLFNPEKLFFTVPTIPQLRQKWLVAFGLDFETKAAYCCEDHFDLQEDTENWMRYRLTGNVRLRLRKDVVPHIFKEQGKTSVKRVAALKLAQKRLVKDALAAAEDKELQEKERLVNEALAAAEHKELQEKKRLFFAEQIITYQPPFPPSKQVYVGPAKRAPKYANKFVSANVKPHIRNKGTQCRMKEKKRNKIKKRKLEVFESSDEETEESRLEDTKFSSPLELVEATLDDAAEDAENSKAVQVSSWAPCHNKGVMCKVPNVRLKKTRSRKVSHEKPMETSLPVLKTDSDRSQPEHYVLLDENTLIYETTNESYLVLNLLSQEHQTNLKPKLKKLILQGESLQKQRLKEADDENSAQNLAPVAIYLQESQQDHMLPELQDERQIKEECDETSVPQIKQEVEEGITNSAEFCVKIKQEPLYDDCSVIKTDTCWV